MWNAGKARILPLVTFIGINIVLACGQEELTPRQKNALVTFRSRLLEKLPDSYMEEDVYLLRFLRARNFNVKQAERLILSDVKWRAENKLVTIHLENFQDVESQGFKVYLESFDREGKPILTANIGNWDLRKAAGPGKFARLKRYIIRSFELASRKVRELQAAGQNVTQWDFLVNADITNNTQTGCMACVPLYLHLINSYERHYPGYADKIIIFNTPQSFDQSIQTVRLLVSGATNKSLKVLNENREVWLVELLKFVDPSELPPEYGGTKVYSDSSQQQ